MQKNKIFEDNDFYEYLERELFITGKREGLGKEALENRVPLYLDGYSKDNTTVNDLNTYILK